jgi:hypothetical protein
MSLAVTVVVTVLMVAVRPAQFPRSHGVGCIGVLRLIRNGRQELVAQAGEQEAR